jgi:hypothetical protein
MAHRQNYFCWIRVLNVGELASVHIGPLATSKPIYDLGHRPPWTARSLDRAVSDDLDAWSAERNVGKAKAKVVFQSGPAYRSRVSALAWLQSREGKRWAAEAENYMLMNFEREPADAPPIPAPSPAPNHSGGTNKSSNHDTGEGLYPRERWDEVFRGLPEQKPQRELFDFLDIDDPSKWDVPPLTAKIVDECKVLIDDRKPKRAANESRIFDEAIEERRAIQPVLDVFGLDYDIDPEALQLVGMINDNASYLIYQFKMRYARARPWQMCDAKTLDAMFPPGHFLHPGHAAYPSGHATWVHLWAELIGTLLKDDTKKANAHKVASEVAERREIAGLHYPADSVAGRQLGIEIAQRIYTSGRLTDFEKMALLNQ